MNKSHWYVFSVCFDMTSSIGRSLEYPKMSPSEFWHRLWGVQGCVFWILLQIMQVGRKFLLEWEKNETIYINLSNNESDYAKNAGLAPPSYFS